MLEPPNKKANIADAVTITIAMTMTSTIANIGSLASGINSVLWRDPISVTHKQRPCSREWVTLGIEHTRPNVVAASA